MRNRRPESDIEPTPYFKDRSGVLFCSDHIDVLKRLPSQSVDLVITSPPDEDHKITQGYQFDYRSLAQQLYRVLRVGGIIVWIVAECIRLGAETLDVTEQKNYFVTKAGFVIHSTMILATKTHFPRTCNEDRKYKTGYEYMLIFSKGGKARYFNPREHRKSNLWLSRGRSKNIIPDPPFAKKIITDHILTWSQEGDVILDPMAGSGVVLRQARLLGRKWIGIEIQQPLCDKFLKKYKERCGNA